MIQANLFRPTILAIAITQSLMLSNATAATLEVNNSGDAGAGCTLRDAVVAINTDGGTLDGCVNSSSDGFGTNDQIIFSVSAIALTGASLKPNKDMTISGDASNVSITTSSTSRIFDFQVPNVSVTLKNLTLENSNATNAGGAISVFNSSLNILNSSLDNNTSGNGGGALSIVTTTSSLSPASLNIVNSTLTGNQSISAGGAIHASGATNITISDSVISSNSATSTVLSGVPGGGILLSSGVSLTLSDSTVSNNAATRGGGGIYGLSNTRATIENSTITGNSASAGGGISLGSQSIWEIKSSTISGNTAEFGGGVFIYSSNITINNSTLSGNFGSSQSSAIQARKNSELTLRNTTVYGGSAGASGNDSVILAEGSTFNLYNSSISGPAGSLVPNCREINFPNGNIPGVVNAGSDNIIDDGTCSTSALAVDPKLGPLANNGGPTKTHALLAGSPAIGAADPARCPGADQRGEYRDAGELTFPVRTKNNKLAVISLIGECDIGAFEL